jgi:hypothetical protein
MPCMDYSLNCSPCWIRTNTILFLRQVPLPIGLRGYVWGTTDSNRLSIKHLIYSQTRYQLRNTSPCFLSGGKWTRTTIFGFSDQRLDHLGYSSKILRRQRESNRYGEPFPILAYYLFSRQAPRPFGLPPIVPPAGVEPTRSTL